MKTIPLPVRLEQDLHEALNEGARRTPHKKQELIRLTLRRHLREVIEQESAVQTSPRITNVKPWSARELKKAYQRIGREWDQLEEAAVRAQGRPDFND